MSLDQYFAVIQQIYAIYGQLKLAELHQPMKWLGIYPNLTLNMVPHFRDEMYGDVKTYGDIT